MAPDSSSTAPSRGRFNSVSNQFVLIAGTGRPPALIWRAAAATAGKLSCPTPRTNHWPASTQRTRLGAALRLTSEPAKPSIALAIGAPRFHRRVNSDSAVLQAFSRSGGNCASSVHSACLMDGPRTWRKDSERIRSSSSGRSSVAPRSSC